MPPMKFIFIVQGEGRGHMTQAISVYSVLKKAGHLVTCVMVGINPHREIPSFVKNQMDTELIPFDCPGFVMDSKVKAVKLIPSVISNLLNLRLFIKSIQNIHRKVKLHQPDVIVNFYTPLAGLYNYFYRPSAPMVSIAHQYIYLHPDYVFPPGKFADRFAIKFYTKLTSLVSKKKLALSFYPINDCSERGIVGFPPLLRKEVFVQEISKRDFLLVYLVNSGYKEEIIQWHKKFPETELHCFTDQRLPEELSDKTLHFHYLDDTRFLQLMAQCRGLVSTAGFESVCEAKYMGKPVLMVPVEGNYEQFCNADDACKVGTGIKDETFNIERFLDFLSSFNQQPTEFRQWVNSTEEKILEQLVGR